MLSYSLQHVCDCFAVPSLAAERAELEAADARQLICGSEDDGFLRFLAANFLSSGRHQQALQCLQRLTVLAPGGAGWACGWALAQEKQPRHMHFNKGVLGVGQHCTPVQLSQDVLHAHPVLAGQLACAEDCTKMCSTALLPAVQRSTAGSTCSIVSLGQGEHK